MKTTAAVASGPDTIPRRGQHDEDGRELNYGTAGRPAPRETAPEDAPTTSASSGADRAPER
eukprot:6752753-Pyramimonas_sp.AAC.1